MTCKNCGTELPESSKFCTKCGTPTSDEELNISAAGVERAVPKGFSAKKNIIIIIIAAILLIGGGIAAIAVVNSHSASSGVGDRLQLAERYLNEQNYEQAIIEYQKVLEIEPMNVDAYLGIAEAYIGMGDTDKALEWLNRGYEQTGNVRIQAKINELTKPVESEISKPEISAPEVPETSEPEVPETSELEEPETSDPEEPEISEPTEPVYGPMGSVTILGEEYDIATTTWLSLNNRGITDTQLREIAPEIAKLTNLTGLDLERNQISDITPLGNLTNLSKVNLGINSISDISKLSNLTNITELDLNNNRISDISSLANLKQLTDLNLFANEVLMDISPLYELKQLTVLNLSVNQISDVSPLENLTNLTELGLYDNNISDITPLFKLKNLKELAYWSNLTKRSDLEQLRLQLPNCKIIN